MECYFKGRDSKARPDKLCKEAFSAGIPLRMPKMILFDYGQTLISQAKFNGVRGTQAVLRYATRNKYKRTASQIQAEAEAINRELGRADHSTRHQFQVEVPNHMFTSYLYASQGIELSIDADTVDRVFWDAASPGEATKGIGEFLQYLAGKGIRTGVVSNLAFSGKALRERIQSCIPDHSFEYILATSEYLYRKPNRRIFELALEMADLSPEEVWYVGDDYECDIAGASNAGIFPVWYLGAIDMEYELREGILTIMNWGELKGVLEKAG